MKNMNFQVNLQGVIELLSNHLYSDPGVFVRELLQNAVDAITARKRLGHRFEAEVKLELFSGNTLSLTDNGCGLTEAEIGLFLARIGSTTKKDDPDAADDYIGQFGVGLLSCFIVSEEIVLITRSALDGDSLEWRGKPDGTYAIRKLERQAPTGTTVYLKAKPDFEEYFLYYRLRNLMSHYGQYLPIPIDLSQDGDVERINDPLPPWKMDKDAAASYIAGMYNLEPLDVIPLRSAIGGVEGIAYVLPHAVSLHDEKKHKVYLKNMLLSDKLGNLLPSWAFFLNAVVNTVSLRPTASREAFQENALFFAVRDELGECVKRYLLTLHEQDPGLFRRLVVVHYASLKSMAVEDGELYGQFIRHLNFETSFGDMSMGEILQNHRHLWVASTYDEFRQIARVAKAQNQLVVNGGYAHDLELALKVPSIDAQARVEVLDVLAFAARFEELDREERNAVTPFAVYSDELLKRFDCRALVRWFEPADIPALYTADRETNFFRLAEESEQTAGPLFAEVVRTIRSELYKDAGARICYNYNNPLVRKAIASGEKRTQKVCIELFYTQALLMGNRPLDTEELRLMNESLLYFMNLGLDGASGVEA